MTRIRQNDQGKAERFYRIESDVRMQEVPSWDFRRAVAHIPFCLFHGTIPPETAFNAKQGDVTVLLPEDFWMLLGVLRDNGGYHSAREKYENATDRLMRLVDARLEAADISAIISPTGVTARRGKGRI